jgi:hypothetical protein
MATISKINPAAGTEYAASTVADQNFVGLNVVGSKQTFFSGFQPLFIKIAGTGIATLDTQASPTSTVVLGTRSKALKAVAAFGTIVGVDRANATTALTVVVDANSFNTGNGAGGNGSDTNDFSGLKAAVAAATGVSSGSITITAGYTIASAGTIDFA